MKSESIELKAEAIGELRRPLLGNEIVPKPRDRTNGAADGKRRILAVRWESEQADTVGVAYNSGNMWAGRLRS